MKRKNFHSPRKIEHCEKGIRNLEIGLVYVNCDHAGAARAWRGRATGAGLKGEERDARCKQIIISLAPLSWKFL